MWTPFRAARERRERDHAFQLAALQALQDVAKSQSDAYRALAEALRDYFDSFKTQREPQRWAANDLEEAKREQEEIALAAGFPRTDERTALRWLERELDT